MKLGMGLRMLLAAVLIGGAMLGIAAIFYAPPNDAAPGSRTPDWALLAAAGAAFLIGRLVIRSGPRPRPKQRR
ncbi:hypothetical protein HNP60_000230 [Sphingobium sp. B1D3A]|uniref:Uncharacterized protein n=1 Tax=Sphingobium lignivorans TaxID=2735886 RepID=A0ABR6NAF0_9SPHN|nr:hypothetical protein [Sphingobium lignivorans]